MTKVRGKAPKGAALFQSPKPRRSSSTTETGAPPVTPSSPRSDPVHGRKSERQRTVKRKSDADDDSASSHDTAATPPAKKQRSKVIPESIDPALYATLSTKTIKALTAVAKQLPPLMPGDTTTSLIDDKPDKHTLVVRIAERQQALAEAAKIAADATHNDGDADTDDDPSPESERRASAIQAFEIRRASLAHVLREKGFGASATAFLCETIAYPPGDVTAFIATQERSLQEGTKALRDAPHGANLKAAPVPGSEPHPAPRLCLVCNAATPSGDNKLCTSCDVRHPMASKPSPAPDDVPPAPATAHSTKPGELDFAFTSIPDHVLKLFPEHRRADLYHNGELFSFLSRIDTAVLTATSKRTFVPLHYYRLGNFSEVTSSAMSLAGLTTGANSLIISPDGELKPANGLKFTPKPIKDEQSLLQSLSVLHRVEMHFRQSYDSIHDDTTSVREWCAAYGWANVLPLVEQTRHLRMANKSYDVVGLRDPPTHLFYKMATRAWADGEAPSSSTGTSTKSGGNSSSSSSNGKKSNNRASNHTNGNGSGSQANGNVKIPKDLADSCRADGFCLKFQRGTCPESGDHTITPRKGGSPYPVKHVCAKCKQTGHGISAGVC